jgi:SAM-dependent methyltransferase
MTPPADAPFWYGMLPRLGTPQEFQAAREFLESSAFDYASVCARIGTEHLYLFSTAMEAAYLQRPVSDRLDVLIRLLINGRAMKAIEVEQWLGSGGVQSLAALGLLAPQPGQAENWFAPVMAHPVTGSVMVCDRNATPEGVALKSVPADALYPALLQNTLDFVARFPQTPCERILEIGTGTGTAAIRWSKLAREVWATDITERSVHFAEFNCRLAGVNNVKVVKGDLYEPVEGLTFDRIACHPPYVPARNSQMIFRDGGEDGEQIARSIVQGLPRYLRPGGLFWASFMVSDRRGESAERRIRSWLGDSNSEFDIGLAVDARRSTAETIGQTALSGKSSAEDLRYFGELWNANHTEFLVHGSVLMRRHDGARAPATRRMQTGTGFNAGHLEWLLDWDVALQQPDFIGSLLESRPRLAPKCDLIANQRLEGGSIASEQFTLEPDGPIRGACRCPGWLVQMLLKCDGNRTVGEHLEALRSKGAVPSDGDPLEFAKVVAGLVAAGMLSVDVGSK